jgi:hypothetical protein
MVAFAEEKVESSQNCWRSAAHLFGRAYVEKTFGFSEGLLRTLNSFLHCFMFGHKRSGHFTNDESAENMSVSPTWAVSGSRG